MQNSLHRRMHKLLLGGPAGEAFSGLQVETGNLLCAKRARSCENDAKVFASLHLGVV